MNYLVAPESVAERQAIFRQLAEALGPNDRLEMVSDFVEFHAKIARFSNPEIIVMLAVGKNDMANLPSIGVVIRDAAIIIMLSEYEQNLVSSAIRLRPKFIGVMDEDLEKIVPIVKKIVQTQIAREQKYSHDGKLKQ
ncbi:MAG: hypothetical protein JXR76_07520 [Deltaproteobacteria bacterium]|nr:hypothetical protein [Deltaproteobacteria bacterium]